MPSFWKAGTSAAVAPAVPPSCDAAAPGVTAATMFYRIAPGETRARILDPGDVAGACTLAAGLACDATIQGGCSAAEGRGGTTAGWLAALAWVAARRRRARLPVTTG